MIVKSNSVPNFLFEKPVNYSTRKLSYKLLNKKKVMSDEDYIKSKAKLSEKEKIDTINALYDIFFKK